MWQHGQQRSSACQLLNKNSSCSPTIGGLLEVSSAAMTEREDGETRSFSLPLSLSTYICIPSSQSSYPQSGSLQLSQPGVLHHLVFCMSFVLKYNFKVLLRYFTPLLHDINKTATVKLLVTFQFKSLHKVIYQYNTFNCPKVYKVVKNSSTTTGNTACALMH